MELTPQNMEKYTESEEVRYRKAKKQAQEIKAFYINLTCYCTVIPMLIFINLYFMPEFIWFYFSMIGWGIGLFFHAMGAFKFNPFFGKDWEERKIREMMEKEKSKNNNQY